MQAQQSSGLQVLSERTSAAAQPHPLSENLTFLIECADGVVKKIQCGSNTYLSEFRTLLQSEGMDISFVNFEGSIAPSDQETLGKHYRISDQLTIHAKMDPGERRWLNIFPLGFSEPPLDSPAPSVMQPPLLPKSYVVQEEKEGADAGLNKDRLFLGKASTGEPLFVELVWTDTIPDVKEKIRKKYGYETASQELTFDGRLFSEKVQLKDIRPLLQLLAKDATVQYGAGITLQIPQQNGRLVKQQPPAASLVKRDAKNIDPKGAAFSAAQRSPKDEVTLHVMRQKDPHDELSGGKSDAGKNHTQPSSSSLSTQGLFVAMKKSTPTKAAWGIAGIYGLVVGVDFLVRAILHKSAGNLLSKSVGGLQCSAMLGIILAAIAVVVTVMGPVKDTCRSQQSAAMR